MRYIYMHNFRGFSNDLVPLCETNFLVGENSTGKSSFLSLLYALNNPQLLINAEFVLGPGAEPSPFSDMFSAWKTDSDRFVVGLVNLFKHSNSKITLSFTLFEFGDRQGNAKLMTFVRARSLDGLIAVNFEKGGLRYCKRPWKSEFKTFIDAMRAFKSQLAAKYDFAPIPRIFPKGMSSRDAPLPLVLPLLSTLDQGGKKPGDNYKIETLTVDDIAWIAPIRSKPKRTYDGINVGYSPEGEHSPVLLRKTLRSQTRSREFLKRLDEFGSTSGLFETIVAHSFGKGDKRPFELLVRFSGAELNISNVGYGVSQVLPLLVEFLSSDKPRTFVIQQPEVHLHPKAQAALGGLIHLLARDKKHRFFIETHSDFLIDRYRLEMRRDKTPRNTQTLFFSRSRTGNSVHPIAISEKGLYSTEQPKEFRSFFLRESSRLLDL